MTGIRTEYSALVSKRDIIFPDFRRLQEKSALDVYDELRPALEQGRISCVIDVGCGTGEILCQLAQYIERGNPILAKKIDLIGFDVNRKSINAARRLAKSCGQTSIDIAFNCIAPHTTLLEEFETAMRRQGKAVAYDQVATICTGHTFFHLHYLPALFKALRESIQKRPRIWLIDVYSSLDEILEGLGQGEHLERRSEHGDKRQKFEYLLYTRKGPEGSNRLERGLYEVPVGLNHSRRKVVSTSQLAWSESDLMENFASAGYAVSGKHQVDTGYGRMNRICFTRLTS
jgi:SAM-dependent methyltransferase